MDSKDNLSEEELKIVDAIIEEETKKQEPKKEETINSATETTKEKEETSNEEKAPEKTNSILDFYKRYTFLISVAISAVAIAIGYILGEQGIMFFREVVFVVYLAAAIGFFISVLRLILKVQNVIVRIILGFFHVGFWIFVSFIAYIIMALVYCSYGNLTYYHEKAYVEEYGLFSSAGYHEVINPFMYKDDRVDEALENTIDVYGN